MRPITINKKNSQKRFLYVMMDAFSKKCGRMKIRTRGGVEAGKIYRRPLSLLYSWPLIAFCFEHFPRIL